MIFTAKEKECLKLSHFFVSFKKYTHPDKGLTFSDWKTEKFNVGKKKNIYI